MPAWLFSSLRGYRREWLRGDLLAGLAVWAVLVPESLAYASLAGVSPVVGLYAAPGALILYAALGSSRHLITGLGAATSALSAATVGAYAAGGSNKFVVMTAALALSAGVILLLAGVLRLGFIASFISEPVFKGFIAGLALTIIVGQLFTLVGVSSGSGDFFQKLWSLLSKLGDAHGLTVLVGTVSLAIVLTLRRFAPSVPGALAAAVFGVAAVEIFTLNHHGVTIVGHITRGLPSLGVPHLAFHEYLRLAGAGVGVTLVGFAEGLSAARAYAAKHDYAIDTNRELIGNGSASMASGLSGGIVVSGSLTKTAVAGSAGANSQLSGLVVAALTIVTLLVLLGPFEALPEATLAAIVIAALIGLVDVRAFVRLYRVSASPSGGLAARPDFIAAVAALLGVTVFSTLAGLFIGIGSSLALLLYRVSRPRVAELGEVPGTPDQYADVEKHPENRSPPGIAILRVESGLFFANAELVSKRLHEAASSDGTRAVVLDAETTPFLDVTAVNMLDRATADLKHKGVRLLVARDIGAVRDVLRSAGADATLTNVYPSVQAAVEAVEREQGRRSSARSG
jgi:sulfate permease, SulP family